MPTSNPVENSRLDLSHGDLELVVTTGAGLKIERCGRVGGPSWGCPGSGLFGARVDGDWLDASLGIASLSRLDPQGPEKATRDVTITLKYASKNVEADLHIASHDHTALIEQWITIRNSGDRSLRIDRMDSLSLLLPAASYQLQYFTSGWGAEFEPVRMPLDGPVHLQSRSGRSSNGIEPWFALLRGEEILTGAVAWSGNWVVRLEPVEGGCVVRAGLHDHGFFADVAPGDSIDSPRVVIAVGHSDIDSVAQQYHRAGRTRWYPKNAVSRQLPVEWNHWWSYEDQAIDEATFRKNIEAAQRLGVELCTLDAGWFGRPNAHWHDVRGDWDTVNATRFPSGVEALSACAHARGLLFGLWCELEGLGREARLGHDHPEFTATRDGAVLGYICFGSPTVQEWAYRTLSRLAEACNCDWIKLDFNVDPGAGCNRSDHGHGPGDGLYSHYMGYYRTLDRFRARHPDVVLENCSSGGLRNDLGIARHTHVSFLSDPDWPEHNLQVFWGATMMLAPEVCLHWGPSQWLTPHTHQSFDPHDPTLTTQELDFAIRTAMLGAAGLSLRLPELPPRVAERIAFHVHLYKTCIRRFVRDGVLHRLTGQPRRDGSGDRWCVFQYSLETEHLLVVFRLSGAEERRTVAPASLRPHARYELRNLDDGSVRLMSGSELMREGIDLDRLCEEDSSIILLSEQRSNA